MTYLKFFNGFKGICAMCEAFLQISTTRDAYLFQPKPRHFFSSTHNSSKQSSLATIIVNVRYTGTLKYIKRTEKSAGKNKDLIHIGFQAIARYKLNKK